MTTCNDCRFFLNERGGICGVNQNPQEAEEQRFCLFKEVGERPKIQGTPLSYWEWNKLNGRVEQVPKSLKRGKKWWLVHFERKQYTIQNRNRVQIKIAWRFIPGTYWRIISEVDPLLQKQLQKPLQKVENIESKVDWSKSVLWYTFEYSYPKRRSTNSA